MKRKEFLQSMCGYGVCSCLGVTMLSGCGTPGPASTSDVAAPPPGSPPAQTREQWLIEFMRQRHFDLVKALEAGTDSETAGRIMAQVGRQCVKDMAADFKGDPDRWFEFAKSRWYESVDYDRARGMIQVRQKNGECSCPFVQKGQAPAFLCDCTVGAQTILYESIFERPVRITLNETVLRGGERCSFTVQLA
jgi:hypothetical protein